MLEVFTSGGGGGEETSEDIPVKDGEKIFQIKDEARPGVREGKGGKGSIRFSCEVGGKSRGSAINLRKEVVQGTDGSGGVLKRVVLADVFHRSFFIKGNRRGNWSLHMCLKAESRTSSVGEW